MSGSDRLAAAVARFHDVRAGSPVNQAPGCVYGLLTREDLDGLTSEVSRLRGAVDRTNGLLVGLLVSIVLTVIGLALRGVFG